MPDRVSTSYKKHQQRRSKKVIQRRKIVRVKRSRSLLAKQLKNRHYKAYLSKYGPLSPLQRSSLREVISNEVEFSSYVKVEAPAVFSFLQNTNEVLRFISKLEKCLKAKKKTFVVFRDIVEMHHDAIIVLASILRRFKEDRVDFNGDFPANESARKVLVESQFFNELYGTSLRRELRYSKSNSFIHSRTRNNKKVDVDLANNLICVAATTVWSAPNRCPGIYRMLIELMTNTHNHAEIGQKGSESWYLCVVHLEKEKKVIFSFVDYGVGVITSLQNKKPGEKMYGFLQGLLRFFASKPTNAEIVREIFLEEKQVSSTGQSHRGYGLPSLYNSFIEQEIMNFNYITNDVRFDAQNKDFALLSENFSGAFIYWELNQSCDHLNPLP